MPNTSRASAASYWSTRCVRGSREFGARAVVVGAIDDDAATFYRHFGFHDLDDRRLWRRLNDIDRAVGG